MIRILRMRKLFSAQYAEIKTDIRRKERLEFSHLPLKWM